MPAYEMLLRLTFVTTGLWMALNGAMLFEAGDTIGGSLLFALGAAVVGLQGWRAVKALRGGDKGE
jgi:hypothetical protein